MTLMVSMVEKKDKEVGEKSGRRTVKNKWLRKTGTTFMTHRGLIVMMSINTVMRKSGRLESGKTGCTLTG